MDKEEAKQYILDHLESKGGSKTKFYFNDFTKLFPEWKMRDVKKLLTELIQEQKLEYWSSGSTTLYGLSGKGKRQEG